MPVNPIPSGFHTLTPYLVVEKAMKLIDFLKEAMDAKVMHISTHEGSVMHATLQIGNSMLMLGDARPPQWPAKPTGLYVYVPNVDEMYARAIKACATSLNAPRDVFYGDRMAGFTDASGNFWWLATHVEDVSEAEMEIRRQKLFGGAAKH